MSTFHGDAVHGRDHRLAQRVRSFVASSRQVRAYRYVFAAGLTLLALLLTLLVPPLREQTPFLLLLTAVTFSALYGGLGPGLLATGLGLLAMNAAVAVTHPPQAFPALADAVRLGVFLVIAVLISWLTEQRRRAERILRERERHFRMMIENTSDVITVLGAEGVIRYGSPSLERVLGYTPPELVGHSVFELIHPDDIPSTRDALQQSLSAPGATTPPVEARLRAKDGTWRTLEAIGKNLLDEELVGGLLLHSRDITDRKQLLREQESRREAEKAHRRFHDLVEGLDAIVWEADPQTRRLTFVSRRAEQILGYPRSLWLEASGWLRHIFPHDRARVLRFLREVPAGGSGDCEYRAVAASGRQLWLRLIVYAVRDDAGTVQQLRGLLVDVTERRQSEAALRVSERLAATGRLAATIAHEINNPMAAVTNLLYLLQNDSHLDGTARHYAQLAQEELARMAHITRQMLGFYRESARAVPVSLTELLDSVLDLYQRRIQNAGVTVERRYAETPVVPVFPGEIRQVFSNILLNALDAVPPQGRITLHLFGTRDWAQPDRHGVRIIFADNGPGIRPEILRRLFEPFFTTKGQKGTGLGLWVSQGIVQKHHGRIRVHSVRASGRSGTVFSIFLPRASGASAAGAGTAA